VDHGFGGHVLFNLFKFVIYLCCYTYTFSDRGHEGNKLSYFMLCQQTDMQVKLCSQLYSPCGFG
jgi:hypothetical protein